MAELRIPELSLVLLIGVSGSGKSTFGRTHFKPTEVISSDFCRGVVADDENDQAATKQAFQLLHYIVGLRLAAGRLTVVDATNVQPESRRALLAVAKEHDVLATAIVLDLPSGVCVARNASRPDRNFGPDVIKRQHHQLRRGMRGMAREGLRTVHVLSSEAEIAEATIVRTRLYNDRRDEAGPFHVVRDVHGCPAEFETLLGQLGYTITRDDHGRPTGAHHHSRRMIFVGDLVDRGPDTPGVLRLVMGMVATGDALCVSGNHEAKLLRALNGRQVQVSHGLAETLDQLGREDPAFQAEVRAFCDGLISHYVLDGGALVVAHAGLIERYQGRASGRVRSFALYGDTTGETDEYGLPVRLPWARDYRGRAMVLYGHTPTPDAEWVNNTMCLDTGCVFGGHLTALRYPERELVQVAAERVWYEPAKPFPAARTSEQAARDDQQLDLTDVLGRRSVETAHHGRVAVREENAAGALEVMSRFALNPRLLPYLPPTMAPVATSRRPDLLEHPDEAFSSFAADGVAQVVCEEKHMGSRAVLLVCRDPEVAARRFGDTSPAGGAVYTRTGRSFLRPVLTAALLDRVRAAASAAGLWDELSTDWLLLDAELLPWSAKADALLRQQYAAVGSAARLALPPAVTALEQAAARGLEVGVLLDRTRERASNAAGFTRAYGRYVWETDGLDGVLVAPFQLLASEARTWSDHDHLWHLGLADRLVEAAPTTFWPTRRLVVDTGDEGSTADGVTWWEGLTSAGGEGMVVKPLANLVRGPKGLVQPGLKVRGREYLRIVYGPDYTLPANLERLRARNLGHKRSLALREHALGLEALDRLVRAEPLWRVHEAVFAVLALESEPVDPRL